MTNISKNRRSSHAKFVGMDDHGEFLSRISKTLYYKKFPQREGLSLPITEFATEIFTNVKDGKSLDRLDVEEASRISRQACVSPCSFVLALLYLERLKDCNPEYLQKVAPSELFLVSLMVASKFLVDDGESDEVYNSEWAQSGHISTAKINRLEMEFLKAINWTVFVHDEEFWRKLRNLERDIAHKEGQKRGWFSYTDLNALLKVEQLETLLSTIFSVSSVFIATYAAGILTLLGSILLTNRFAINALTSLKTTQCSNLTDHFSVLRNESCQTELGQDELEQNLLDDLTESEIESCGNVAIDSTKTVDSITFSAHPNTYTQTHKWKKRFLTQRSDDSNFPIGYKFFQAVNEEFSLPNWIDFLPKLNVNQRR